MDIIPDCGIHKGVDFETYLGWHAISQSVLKEPSQLHMKAAFEGKLKVPTTDAIRFGSAIHCYMLEPDHFEARYPVATPCSMPLKSGKRKGQPCGATSSFRDGDWWFCGTHAPDSSVKEDGRVSPDEFDRIRFIAEKLDSHPIGRLLRLPGENELSIVADVDGIRMKGRIDRFLDAPCIIDVKKINLRDGTRDKLRRKIRDYGYDFQAAAYSRIFYEITGERPGYMWLFVESDYPHDLIPVQAGEDLMFVGQVKFDAALHRWRDAVESNTWLGCEGVWCGGDTVDTVPKIDPDEWERKQFLGGT
jgi:hypothetical protein